MFVGEYHVQLRDIAQFHHRITAKLRMVNGKEYAATVIDNRLFNANFMVIKVQQWAIKVDTTDAQNTEIEAELFDEIECRFTDNAAVSVANFTTRLNHFDFRVR